MGFAKYNEDIASRFNNDNYRGKAPSVARPKSKPKPKSVVKSVEKQQKSVGKPAEKQSKVAEKAGEKLKEFTIASARPLPVIVLADISGSMSEHGKIQSMNQAIREMLEAFRDEDDLRAEIHVSVITFGRSEARIHLPLTAASKATWKDMPAAGNTPMGAAFETARLLIEDKSLIPSRAYRPTIVLVTDGQPTDADAWKTSLQALLASERGGKALRMAMGIGPDADLSVLRAFLGDPAGKVYQAQDARQIRQFFEFLTMSVTSRSRSANPNVAPATPADLDF